MKTVQTSKHPNMSHSLPIPFSTLLHHIPIVGNKIIIVESYTLATILIVGIISVFNHHRLEENYDVFCIDHYWERVSRAD